MLKVYFGEMSDALEYPDFFFDNIFDKGYLLSEFSRNVVSIVDKSEVKDKNVIVSPVMGGISPRDLSTGVKNVLICRYYPDRVVCFSYMGSNCLSPLFGEIVKNDLDRTVCADILYIPYNYDYEGDILILNTGKVVSNDDEFLEEYLKWRGNR